MGTSMDAWMHLPSLWGLISITGGRCVTSASRDDAGLVIDFGNGVSHTLFTRGTVGTPSFIQLAVILTVGQDPTEQGYSCSAAAEREIARGVKETVLHYRGLRHSAQIDGGNEKHL